MKTQIQTLNQIQNEKIQVRKTINVNEIPVVNRNITHEVRSD